MQKQNKMRTRRIRNLIVIFSLTAVILSVSTYAWFIGMRTVSVSSFDVEIAATESLYLSLNGDTWLDTVSISKDTVTTSSYTGNTNWWAGKGLIPMSSVGDMDVNASRMKLFEKASLTATKGGYRLLSSRVNNHEFVSGSSGPLVSEQKGYVAFDLFIKNLTGTQYIETLQPLDEEAIYLTTDSKVTVAQVGGVQGTGIENSVRVAFAQIGRVAGTTSDVAKITGITCESDNDETTPAPSIIDHVTGICRTAQIWEPNDTLHVDYAIGWYNTACKARTGALVTAAASYGEAGTCNPIVNEEAYETYAVKEAIASSDNVDVYDGTDYNKYAATTKLFAYDTFTDTEKDFTGTARPEFMTLAPNSITKVRIYIYIEGQDIDNYDFASIGKQISVQFGFTKERFIESDTGYTGPSLNNGEDPETTTTTTTSE